MPETSPQSPLDGAGQSVGDQGDRTDAGVAAPAIDGAALKMELLGNQDSPFILQQYPLPAENPSWSPRLVAAWAPDHRVVEQLRSVRMQLMLPAADGAVEPPVVAILGNERGVGRSFMAANLSILFAQLGCRTLLIDADLRNPSQHTLFKLDNSQGLSTLLLRPGSTDCIRRVDSLPHLHVLTAGPLPPNSRELLEQLSFGQLLKYVSGQCGAVIIDTPAIELGNDAHRVASHARQTLLVVRRGHTHATSARRLVDGLRRSGANLAGIIYNAS
jgi:receptor protein-tyrosine kinase